MDKGKGYFVFTPLSGEQFVKIHRYECKFTWIKPDHIHRAQSWHWFQTYNEAFEYAQNELKKGRTIKNYLNDPFCRPG